MAKTRKKDAGTSTGAPAQGSSSETESRSGDGAPGESASQTQEPAAAEAAPQAAGDTTAADLDRSQIAQRAYELYLARGGSDGQAMDDWLTAEREMSGREQGRDQN